jgi:mono/diheme cytochrome c family protein
MYARFTSLVFVVAAAHGRVAATQDKVDFQTQVRPIFAERCYECHGPKEQEGDLRLDQRARAFPANEEYWVIRPGKPQDSELVKRIKLPKNDADVMPAEGDPLTSEQIALIERWIAEGAHWPESATPAAAGRTKSG